MRGSGQAMRFERDRAERQRVAVARIGAGKAVAAGMADQGVRAEGDRIIDAGDGVAADGDDRPAGVDQASGARSAPPQPSTLSPFGGDPDAVRIDARGLVLAGFGAHLDDEAPGDVAIAAVRGSAARLGARTEMASPSRR